MLLKARTKKKKPLLIFKNKQIALEHNQFQTFLLEKNQI